MLLAVFQENTVNRLVFCNVIALEPSVALADAQGTVWRISYISFFFCDKLLEVKDLLIDMLDERPQRYAPFMTADIRTESRKREEIAGKAFPQAGCACRDGFSQAGYACSDVFCRLDMPAKMLCK